MTSIKEALRIARRYIADDVKRKPSDYDPSADLHAVDSALAQLGSADANGIWHGAGNAPLIKPGTSQQYILAVYRKHRDKVYSFAAEYLNDYPLRYEWGCPKGRKGICGGCSADDGCPTTGWHVVEGADDDGYTYHALSLDDGDHIEGWREVPRWEDRSTTLLPDASPGNGAEKYCERREKCQEGLGICHCEDEAALHSTSAARETASSDGQRENQPEKRTGPHRASGETNSGSTGDNELTRSAVCPSEAIPADVREESSKQYRDAVDRANRSTDREIADVLAMKDIDPLSEQLRGRAAFLRKAGQIKSPELLERAAAAIDKLSPEVAARARDAELLDFFEKNMGMELSCSWEDDDGPWEVHNVTGGRNDREWAKVGQGATPREAIASAIRTGGQK